MNAPVSGHERQRHVRTATLLRGQLTSGELVCDCEMLNLSIGGMRLRLDQLPQELDRVTVTIDGYAALSGNVVWRAAREIGVEFDFECRETAQQLQADIKPEQVPQDRRRTIRVSVLWSARLMSPDGEAEFPCMVLNISTEGARLRLSSPAKGFDYELIRLHVERLGTLTGKVAWREADEMAIIFDEDPDRIAEMLSIVLPRAQFAAAPSEDTDSR
ncbi:MAG: PilZ domain-containing protein [Alphaproteobacteria bacterium]